MINSPVTTIRMWVTILIIVGCTARVAVSAEPVRRIVSRTADTRIPVVLDRSPAALQQVKSVRLLESPDGGRTWTVKIEQPPTAGEFLIRNPGDGTTLLAVRTVDSRGVMHPSGPVQAEIELVVDTTLPFLSGELQRTQQNTCIARIRCSDMQLDRQSLQLNLKSPLADGTWQTLSSPELKITRNAAGLQAEAVWTQVPADAVTMQVSIADAAGNRTESYATLTAGQFATVATTSERPATVDTAPSVAQLAFQSANPGDGLFVVPQKAPPPTPVDEPQPPRVPTPPAGVPAPPTLTIPFPTPLPTRAPPVQDPADADDPVISPADLPHWQVLQRAARNAVGLGDLKTAISRFEEMLRLVPDDHATRFEYTGLLIQTDRLTEAEAQLQKLTQSRLNETRYRAAYADLLIQQKKYDLARLELREILAREPGNTKAAVQLAKTFAWEQRFEDAVAVYDQYLQGFEALPAEDQRELATLLMALNRTREAFDLLTALRGRETGNNYDATPFSESVQADLILCAVRLLQRSLAMTWIQELPEKPVSDPRLWLKLAEQLYREQAFVEAVAIYDLVALRFPDRAAARLGAARAHLRLFELTAAEQILAELKQTAIDPLAYSTVEADYLTVIGEWTTAISIATRRLRDNPHDLQACILLGDAYHASGQPLKANAVYTRALQLCGEDIAQQAELQRLIAGNLVDSDRYADAIPLLESLATSDPRDIASRLQLIQALTKARQFGLAENWARLRPTDTDPRHRNALKTEAGFVLLKRGRFVDAAREFESLLRSPDEITPDAAYGFYRAQKQLGNLHAARGALLLGPTQFAPPALWTVVVSTRALAHCDCPLAGEVLDQFLKLDPHHQLALNLRGEAASQCDCSCSAGHDESGCELGDCQSCCGHTSGGRFREVLYMNPANIRARLGLARTLATYHQFDEAYAEYMTLLNYAPDHLGIRRETGRMVDGWQGIHRAGSFFSHPGSAATELDAIFNGHNEFGNGPIRLLAGTTSGESANSTAETLMSTEFQARWFRGWRNRCAIPMYEGVIATEPSNEDAYFELGQVYAGMNRTRCAIDAYSRMLKINPCHRQAWTAHNRLQLDLRPQLHVDFEYLSQDGRDGLADMRSTANSVSGRFMLGDVDEFLEIGYRHLVLRPTDDRFNHGNVAFTRIQERLTADWLAFGQIDVAEFDYGFSTRPNFEAGTQYTFFNDAFIRASAFLNNVIENGETIRQDIYRGGLQLSGGWQPHRDWSTSALYRWADYSDNNTLNEFALGGAYQILTGRRQLRALVDYNFLSYAERSRLSVGQTPALAGTVHPYFAPSGFSFASAGMEWKHWLGCDSFIGGQQQFYQLYLGGRFDSQSEAYLLFKSQFYYDIHDWLTWTVDAGMIRSEVYDETTISTHGIIRFR